MFENEGAKEDFSLSHLSSPAMTSNPWSPGYSEASQVCEADDPRIHDSDIKCEYQTNILTFFFGIEKETINASWLLLLGSRNIHTDLAKDVTQYLIVCLRVDKQSEICDLLLTMFGRF